MAAKKLPPTGRTQVLELPKRPDGKTESQDVAELIAYGIAGNAIALQEWAEKTLSLANITDLFVAVQGVGTRVEGGDLSPIEKLLAAQVLTLNASFVTMMQRAKSADRYDVLETYTRLGLRMQNQCRATAETLATMKMPPVFAKNYQANIANGPQQVNNGGAVPPRGEIVEAEPNKLLEAVCDVERVDAGTAGAAAGRDSVLATVEAIDRSTIKRRKGAGVPKRVQGRRSATGARTRS